VARARAVDTDPSADRRGEGPLAPLDAGDPRTVALGGGPPLAGAVAFWSTFVSVVALPDVVVGSWLDDGRGIWSVL
jgi:hypothetical protein